MFYTDYENISNSHSGPRFIINLCHCHFLAVIALREDVVRSVFHSLYFLCESSQKLLLVVGQILGHRVLRNHLSASDLIGTLTADQMVSNIGHSWDQVYRTITRTYGMHFMIRTVCNTLCHIQTVTLTLR